MIAPLQWMAASASSAASTAVVASPTSMAAYNFARRLKALSGLTPYEYIAEIWTSEPDRFIVDTIHQMTGLNT